MKITVVLCLLTTFCSFASVSYSQTTEISLNLQDATLREALDAIKEQTEFSFWYRNEEVNLSKKITVQVNHQKIQEVMAQLLYGQNLAYTIDEKHIIIYRKDKFSEQQVPKKVHGRVTDSHGEPLMGLTVTLKGTKKGTVTDIDGNYFLENVSPENIIVFSYIGMLSQEIRINGKNAIDVTMEEDVVNLQEVVTVGYATIKKKDLTGSVSSINAKQIARIPSNTITSVLVSVPRYSCEWE